MRVESMGGRCRAVIHESHAGLQRLSLLLFHLGWLGLGCFVFAGFFLPVRCLQR